MKLWWVVMVKRASNGSWWLEKIQSIIPDLLLCQPTLTLPMLPFVRILPPFPSRLRKRMEIYFKRKKKEKHSWFWSMSYLTLVVDGLFKLNRKPFHTSAHLECHENVYRYTVTIVFLFFPHSCLHKRYETRRPPEVLHFVYFLSLVLLFNADESQRASRQWKTVTWRIAAWQGHEGPASLQDGP